MPHHQETIMAEQNKIARRSFFAGLGLVTAAGIAAKLSSKTTIAPLAAPAPAEPEGDGYRLTEHVKKYYRTTTI
jgi:hypothetical protein